MKKEKNLSNKDLAAEREGGLAFDALLEQYRPLLSSMTNTFYNRGQAYNLDRDELYQEAQIALYNALQSYNEKQTEVTFGLYAKICVRNRLVSFLRKAKRANRKPQKVHDYRPSEKEAAMAQLSRLRKNVWNMLTQLEKEALDGYLVGDSYAEIARRVGCTAKSVDNALWRVKKKMRQMF